MAGANAGHTSNVTSELHLPLKPVWGVSAEDLGAGPGPAAIHPRVIAAGVLLAEMDVRGAVFLLALDARSGDLLWKLKFNSAGFFPDAGLYPAADDTGAEIFIEQIAAGETEPRGWNLTRLGLRDGKPVWQTGTLTLKAALRASPRSHTLFRPVVQSGSQLLVTPDFFGRPPLVAFNATSGVLQWRCESAGGDPPIVLEDPADPVALSVDYAAGRPILHTILLRDGTTGQALVGAAAGTGENWTEGIWDVQVRWADPASRLCSVGGGRLRPHSSWPTATWVFSTPGATPAAAWELPGVSNLAGPLADGSIFVHQVAVRDGKPLDAIARVTLLTGHTVWAQVEKETPLLAAPELILVRNEDQQLAAILESSGEPVWYYPLRGLSDCIAGEGTVFASYSGPRPSASTAALLAFR